ncbi:hypothetical protein [Streptomyces capoamus]
MDMTIRLLMAGVLRGVGPPRNDASADRRDADGGRAALTGIQRQGI